MVGGSLNLFFNLDRTRWLSEEELDEKTSDTIRAFLLFVTGVSPSAVPRARNPFERGDSGGH